MNKFLKTIGSLVNKDYFSESPQKSMMRLGFFIAMVLVILLALVIISYLVVLIVTNPEAIIDWTGLAAFLTAITALATAFVVGKISQKKTEVKERDPNTDAPS